MKCIKCGTSFEISPMRQRRNDYRCRGCLAAYSREASRKRRARIRRGESLPARLTKRNLPEYSVWRSMVARCCHPYVKCYPRYGGRGISVCERWHTFENFYADMGSRPSSKHSIDRIDNSGNYEPSNCRWATIAEQNNNTRRNILLFFQGKTQTITQWAREAGIDGQTIKNRIAKGWPMGEVLSKRQIGSSASGAQGKA